ncbi:TetR/AcrR family transcriptional regulator [Litorisediminicola beolgyonensis]|uniref:TetR/AcrR family transcriptional regulator n=1 Tax=Litorisediminicola beolgyonensis TaxID=1173614 RepID=A0ABW3ZNH4_9RHOB
MPEDGQQVRRGRKFDQVIEGAREIFLRDGFEGASVDDIARAAGVSKATLYNYFPDKRLLFMEVGRSSCEEQANAAIASIDRALPPREVLTRAGQAFLSIIFSQLNLQTFRVCVGEAERFPELAEQFYCMGPMVMRCAMSQYFREAIDRGELAIDDLTLAADQFGELCKAHYWPEMLFGLRKEVSEEERSRVVDEAVRTFLARYGTENDA